MRRHFVIMGLFVALVCPFVASAQYDMVAGSTREEQAVLKSGEPVQRQTFRIAPRTVARFKNFAATVLHDAHSGLVWFTFEAMDNSETVPPTQDWIVAKSKDGRSLVGFEADGAHLTFRTSNRTVGSRESARSLAMTELAAEIAAYESNQTTAPPRVDLRPHLDFSSFSGASGLRHGDIKRVTATDGGWLVELASHPSVAKTAYVSLSEKFEVLKVDVRRN
jgi:hypothetical protein